MANEDSFMAAFLARNGRRGFGEFFGAAGGEEVFVIFGPHFPLYWV